MLIALNIQNFALIEQANLAFHPGFTVITGETGSGKSILLGALNLILGERADYGVIRDKEDKTVVEATFRISGFGLEPFFQENDLDFSDETVVRREITAQGRSRAFVNDTPVQLNVLKELSERLVHIHSQHHTLELKNPLFQLDLLDILSDNVQLRQEYKKDYLALRQLNTKLQDKKTELAKMLQDADYNRFQWEELDALKLDVTIYADLETELQSYEKIDDVKAGFASIVQAVADDRGTVDILSLLKSSLEKVQQLHPALSVLSERVVATLVELKDIAEDAEQQLDSLESNPERQAELTERVDIFNRILRKHQVHDQAGLLEIYESLSQSQSSSDALELEIEEMGKTLKDLHGRVQSRAVQLHENRVKKAPAIASQLMEVLDELKLVQTQITFELEKAAKLDETGMTKLVLLFAPNAGLSPKPIEKAASGGELSRFMLALQLLLSAKKQLPTLLFDEIDTGVSGEVAQKIGQVLQKMGAGMQVLAITHLPQVAAKGSNHWKVTKSARQGQTITEVIALNENERVEEIARLMSGENINEAAILNARALMN
jgi:DNA repair protein RecN (Recombination protein N)